MSVNWLTPICQETDGSLLWLLILSRFCLKIANLLFASSSDLYVLPNLDWNSANSAQRIHLCSIKELEAAKAARVEMMHRTF